MSSARSQDDDIQPEGQKMIEVIPPLKTQISMMKMKKKTFWALLAVGIAVVSTGVVSAQSTVPSVGMLGEFKQKSLVGSWEETFTFVGGPQDGRVSKSLSLGLEFAGL
jgi:hypothetical protein